MSLIEELELTEEDLNKEFQIQRATESYEKGIVYFDSTEIWGTPTRFTLRWVIENGYPKSKILKLKQCQVGNRVCLINSNDHVHNKLFARPIDEIDEEIKAKEIALEEIGAEIKRIAGTLIKQQTKLRKEIKLIKENNSR